MATQSNIHFFTNWAKERLDEMDAAVTLLEGKLGEVQSDARDKANAVLAELRKQRDAFRDTINQQSEAGEAAWTQTKTQLEATGVQAGSEIVELRQENRSTSSNVQGSGGPIEGVARRPTNLASTPVAVERRSDINAALQRMNADAAEAEKKLQKFNQAGTESWSALMGALTETRAAFDRANQAAQEAFKKVACSNHRWIWSAQGGQASACPP